MIHLGCSFGSIISSVGEKQFCFLLTPLFCKKIEKEVSKLIELSRLKQTLSRKDISMDYHTKKLLGLTDKNITFPTNWLSEKKEGRITSYVIHGRLDYNPSCCTKCEIKKESIETNFCFDRLSMKFFQFDSPTLLVEEPKK
ncbi:hypothetical protein ACGWY0_002591 [Enterococcus hirae]